MTTTPTIHRNGTGFTTLRDEYANAYGAIQKAIDALATATLNARDYYPQGNHAYYQARDERTAALTKLREVRDYVGIILTSICDQQR